MAGNVIDLEASMSGFDQKEIHIKAGQPVTIRLTSLDNEHHTGGGGKDQWAVDELGVGIIAQLESSKSSITGMATGARTGIMPPTFYPPERASCRGSRSLSGAAQATRPATILIFACYTMGPR